MTSKHTPGPWEYSPHKRVIHVDGKYIAAANTQSISATEREAIAKAEGKT